MTSSAGPVASYPHRCMVPVQGPYSSPPTILEAGTIHMPTFQIRHTLEDEVTQGHKSEWRAQRNLRLQLLPLHTLHTERPELPFLTLSICTRISVSCLPSPASTPVTWPFHLQNPE